MSRGKDWMDEADDAARQQKALDDLTDALQRENQRATDLEGRLRAVSKAYTELKADQEAYRARVEANYAADAEKRVQDAIKPFLEPCEDLDRLYFSETLDAGGVKAVRLAFQRALIFNGVMRVSLNRKFDPQLHEAVDYEDTEYADEDGDIIGNAGGGWILNDTVVLVPAKVKVARYRKP